MPNVSFTPNLRRHVDCPTLTVSGATLNDALQEVFEVNPRLRGYVLDDQGTLRKHMVIFVDGAPARDRKKLSDAVRGDSEIFVMQALTGG